MKILRRAATPQLREGEGANRETDDADAAAADDEAIGFGSPGEQVEAVPVDLKVAVVLAHRHGQPIARERVAIPEFDDEATSRSERLACLAEPGTIALVVEVTERAEPIEHEIEALLPRKVAHVALDLFDLGHEPPRRCVRARGRAGWRRALSRSRRGRRARSRFDRARRARRAPRRRSRARAGARGDPPERLTPRRSRKRRRSRGSPRRTPRAARTPSAKVSPTRNGRGNSPIPPLPCSRANCSARLDTLRGYVCPERDRSRTLE